MTHKDPNKAKEYKKAWYEANKEQMKAKKKAYYEANKEACKARQKAYREANKEQRKASMKAWKEANKEHYSDYQKAYMKAYMKSDLNALGQTKDSIRLKSRAILRKTGTKIQGYQIHHCFGYEDPSKFIYCSREMHMKIHQYLREHGIDADSDHYELIKHLLDATVVKYGLE